MTSQVSICNQALDEIGKDSITSLTEDSTQAFKCRAHYDQVRKSMLCAYPWKFARKVEAMASLDQAKFFTGRWLFTFVTPADCLKVRRIIPEAWHHHDELGAKYEIVGDLIYTNDEHGFLEYTYDFKNEGAFPQLFVDAFALALAARLVMPLTNNLQGKIGIAQLARATYIAATVWDANQIHETSDHHSEMVEARR